MTRTWTAPRLTNLIILWKEGLSATKIGIRLNLSKNAVLGKAHRLGLALRASPFSPGQLGTRRKLRHQQLQEQSQAVPEVLQVAQDLELPILQEKEPAAFHYVAPPLREAAHAPHYQQKQFDRCQWPQGHPGQPGFQYCSAPVDPGRPYCPTHAARAYTSPKLKEKLL